MRLMWGDRVQHNFYGKGTVFDNSWQYDEVYVRFDRIVEGISLRSVHKDSLQRLC
jgi:hypothetical protein